MSANQPESFLITNQYEPDEEKHRLLLRKGVYPYEHMDSWERFQEERLPPQAAFHSTLTGEGISAKDYDHAQKFWSALNCRTMGDYHDLYLRTDVLLLADVFETFRKSGLQQQYGLDPANYYSSPGLSWDALLKSMGVELELLTDYDMHLFIEKGLRGGISMVSKRFTKANNPMVEGYHPDKPTTYIMYLDANNLYGWAMSQALPTGGFEWTDPPSTQELIDHPSDADKGYILEVNLEYPEELHDVHNDYPLAPERLKVDNAWMSNYQLDILRQVYGVHHTSK